MTFTLRQLEIFLVIAQTENISNAAQLLHMSQSAASGALKTLEDQYGIALFDRQGKRLRLSEFGRSIRAEAEALLQQAKALQRKFAGKGNFGPLAVGATQTIGHYLLVDLYASFHLQNPDVPVSFHVANTREICSKVLNFDLDIGLIEGEVNHSQLVIQNWQHDELVVFTTPEHPLVLSGKETLSDEDLCSVPWILREPGSGTRQAFDSAMRGLLPEMHIALEVQHAEAIKRAVSLQMGLGCLSRIALANDFEEGRFVPLKVEHRDLSRRLSIVRHCDKAPSASAEAWIRTCQACFSDNKDL